MEDDLPTTVLSNLLANFTESAKWVAEYKLDEKPYLILEKLVSAKGLFFNI